MSAAASALEWNDLGVILAVGRAGSLSGAARLLGVNHTTVFRKVNAIEERAGVRFFDRMPNGYQLTEAGDAALRCAERIEGEVHVLGREILGADMRLQGPIRVTAMEGLAALVLPGPLAEFSRAHPGVSIALVGTTSQLDLSRREAEVAVRATRKPPESAFGRRMCTFRFGVYASPGYLEGRDGMALTEHDWCLLEGIGPWLVPSVFKRRSDAEERTVMTTTSVVGIAEAAAAGAGVSALPSYMGERDERLVRVGAWLDALEMDLWLLTHPDLRRTARVRALMEFLGEALLERRELFDPGA